MKKIIISVSLMLFSICFAGSKFQPLTKQEKANMDSFVLKEVQNKDLWVNKYAITSVGADLKDEKYFMRGFEHFSKVKGVDVSTADGDCKKSANQLCIYKAFFKDEKGLIETMPVITIFEPATKQYKIFYSTVPFEDASYNFFLTKNPN